MRTPRGDWKGIERNSPLDFPVTTIQSQCNSRIPDLIGWLQPTGLKWSTNFGADAETLGTVYPFDFETYFGSTVNDKELSAQPIDSSTMYPRFVGNLKFSRCTCSLYSKLVRYVRL